MGDPVTAWEERTTSAWPSTVNTFVAWGCIGWYSFVWLICGIGYVQIRKRWSKPAAPFIEPASRNNLPFVSVLRPIKGLDAHLALTLKSTFLLDYPKDLHELLVCVASPNDPCVPIVRSLIEQYPEVNAKLILGEENVGPNPKIRTLSKAYREAHGDIVWLMDSNVWVAPGVLLRMVQKLCGLDQYGQETGKPYKFVHHVPIAVDSEEEYVLDGSLAISGRLRSQSSVLHNFGGILEETFLSTSHAKFYTAINTVAVASCALGKSNMFRKSHLAAVTSSETPGLLDFAHYICEDHLLSERLWLRKVAEEISGERKYGKHALGEDLVFQPLSGMGIKDYWDRRVRWLRVRKYTNIVATLAEPGTESFLCSVIGGYGVITLLEEYGHFRGPDANWWKWVAFVAIWIVSVGVWSFCDHLNYHILHSFANVTIDKNTPQFIRNAREKGIRRRWEGSPVEWLKQWAGREALALPIFLWAMFPGEIHWRGARYVVGWDLKVKEVGAGDTEGKRVE